MPEGAALDVAANVLPAHERNVLAEFGDEGVNQLASMLVFFPRHFLEHFGARRKVSVQRVGVIRVDAAVLFLVGDREGENFLFRKFGEIAHG